MYVYMDMIRIHTRVW